MSSKETKPKKRGRGRPPKKKAKLPLFKDENEIRDYLLKTSLELALECKETAMKKNNIKKPPVANAKNQQYKTALASLKTCNEILKDLQINKLEEKIKLIEEGYIIPSNCTEEEQDLETLEKIEKLSELTEQLANLKE